MTWTSPSNVGSGTASSSQFNTEVLDNLRHLHGAWTDFTPDLVNVTIGNGTISGRYRDADGTIQAKGFLELGSTSSVTGIIQIGLPFDGVTAFEYRHVGSAIVEDNGGRFYPCVARLTPGGDYVTIIHPESGNGGVANATNPITFGTSDRIQFDITYEVA